MSERTQQRFDVRDQFGNVVGCRECGRTSAGPCWQHQRTSTHAAWIKDPASDSKCKECGAHG